MKIMELVPYSSLDEKDWTVDSLILNKQTDSYLLRVALSDIAHFNKIKFEAEKINPNNQYPYIEISSISQDKGLIEDPMYMEGSELLAKTRAKLIVQTGDILLSTVRPDRGIIGIVPHELNNCVVSNGFVVLTPKISAELLYFLLRRDKVLYELGMMAKGSSIPTLTLKQLKEYSLPISEVPIELETEAKRIFNGWQEQNLKKKDLIEISEEIFKKQVHLDEEVPVTESKKYMILPYEQLEDRLNVEFYLYNQFQSVKWDAEVTRLSDLAEGFRMGTPFSSQELSSEGAPYIRIQDLGKDELYIRDNVSSYVNSGIDEKYRIFEGNLIIARVGGSTGKSALVQDKYNGAIVNQNLVVIKLRQEKIIPEYLAYFLKTKWAQEQIARNTVGAAQPFLQLSRLESIFVPTPSINVQSRVVDLIQEELKGNDVNNIKEEFLLFPQQIDCIEALTKALENGKRKLLIQMATGTGKTRTVVAFIQRLFKNRKINRVLYLTERLELENQVLKILELTMPDIPICQLKNSSIEASSSIFVSTYQMFEKVNNVSTDFFDLIVCDGLVWKSNNEWKSVMNFFNAIHLIISSRTQSLEELEQFGLNAPTFRYDFKEAVNNSYISHLSD